MSDLKMPDMNHIIIAGRLTRDPELRYLGSGDAVCNFGIAVSRKYKKDGEKREDNSFLNCVAWKQVAEYLGQNVKKGRPVIIEGSLKSEEWTDKTTGQKRTAIKIQAHRVNTLDWDDRSGGGGDTTKPQATEETGPDEDEIPF